MVYSDFKISFKDDVWQGEMAKGCIRIYDLVDSYFVERANLITPDNCQPLNYRPIPENTNGR